MEKTLTRMSALAPSTMRRMMNNSAQTQASRSYQQFAYPHSHLGTNPAYNNFPVEKRDADRNQKVGDEAPLAQNDVRSFPDWYKPYTFNYTGEGYLALFFGGFCLFGYSYTNDIKEQKGRTSRKIFESELMTHGERARDSYHARKRLAINDAEFEKFTHKKERAAVHH